VHPFKTHVNSKVLGTGFTLKDLDVAALVPSNSVLLDTARSAIDTARWLYFWNDGFDSFLHFMAKMDTVVDGDDVLAGQAAINVVRTIAFLAKRCGYDNIGAIARLRSDLIGVFI
jgi:hypothetical protein